MIIWMKKGNGGDKLYFIGGYILLNNSSFVIISSSKGFGLRLAANFQQEKFMNLSLFLIIIMQMALGFSGMAAAAGAGGPGAPEPLLSGPARDKDVLKDQRKRYLSDHPEIEGKLREDIPYGRCSENSYDYLCSNPEMMELVECVIIASAKFMARVASNVAMLGHIQGVCIYGGMLSMDFIEALQHWPLVSLRIGSCKFANWFV